MTEEFKFGDILTWSDRYEQDVTRIMFIAPASKTSYHGVALVTVADALTLDEATVFSTPMYRKVEDDD